MHAYNLKDFCNIIVMLRKKKAWTQVVLAEKLGVSPQSVSKWECGIGYPDVTLFPLIAEVLSVPIGVLFGEKIEEDILTEQKNFDAEIAVCESIEVSLGNVCESIKVSLGNLCRVEFIGEEGESSRIIAKGDSVFLHYLDVEQEENTLFVYIKNPSGSATHWIEYDRCGYEDENLVQIFTGKKDVNIESLNYLDLEASGGLNEEGNYEVRVKRL